MNISVRKESLLENINIVIRAVSTRSTLPILECILVAADYDGIKLMANDLEISIETDVISAEVNESGSVALESKMFADIIRKLPDDYVKIVSDDKNITIISSGRSEFRILGFPGDEFPLQPQVDKDAMFAVKSAELKNIIRQTIFSVAVDESKPVLTGELFEIKEGGFNVVSVDGFRVSYRRINLSDSGVPDMSLIVPAKPLAELMRILPSGDAESDELPVNIYFSDRHILFEMQGATLVSRLLEGDFYKYELVFAEDFVSVATLDRAQLLSGLERVSLIASKEAKKNPVRLEISGTVMVISSNTEYGAARDEIAVEFDGDNIDISFNPKYLIDVVRAIDEDAVTLNFKSTYGPLIIRPLGNKDANYLVLPLRMRN